MKRYPTKLLSEFIEERTERLRGDTTTIYSVTNERGFVRSLDLFDKQVFSADTGNYKRVEFRDLAYNPSRINVGSIALCEDKNGGAVSPMYVIVRTNHGLLPYYLLHFLKSDAGLHHIRHRCEGAVRFQLKFRDLCAIPITMPPLAEQERIVKLLDDADELRKLRAQADRRSADLIPALFHEMFGDPALNPRRWKLTAISEIAKVQGGLQLTPLRSTYPLKRAYLRVTNVQRGFLVLDEIKEIGLLDSEYERTKLAKGDLLLVEGNGNPKEVGRAAIWDDSVEDCVHQNHLIRVRPNSKSLTSEYLLAFVNSESGRSYFHGSGNTTSGLVTISTSIVKNCRIPVPPLPLQQEFAQRVGEIRALQAAQAASRQRTEHLFQSMLHRAFNQAL